MPTITASSSVATIRSCWTVAGPLARMWARFAEFPLIAVSRPWVTAAAWSMPEPIAQRPGLAAVEVDVLGTEQAVWTDGGGGIGMKLWGVTRVDRHPDQGITVLVFDAVHRPDARPAQFDPGARVQLTIRARLQLEVQPLIPGQREGDEHDDRERDGGGWPTPVWHCGLRWALTWSQAGLTTRYWRRRWSPAASVWETALTSSGCSSRLLVLMAAMPYCVSE